MSQVMASSGLMPRGLEKAEAVFVAVQMGLEVGLSPMAAVQNIAVINGRPSIWGDSVLGLVRASGRLEDFHEFYEGKGEEYKAVCIAKRDDQGNEIRREFSVADAKRAGLWKKAGPWSQYPKRMLQMRARSWALRDGFGDVLRGIRFAEEEQDRIIDVTPGKAPEVAQPVVPTPSTEPVLEAEEAPEAPQETKEEAKEPAGPAIWDRDNWCRMRGGKPAEGTGFGAWVIANLDVITEAYDAGEIEPSLMDEMESKWTKLYPGVGFGELAAPAEETTDKEPAEETPGTGDETPAAADKLAKFEAIGVEVIDSEEAREIIQMVTGSEHLSLLWDHSLKHREFHTIGDLLRVINYLRGQLERETLGNHENK
jgi:hypothetical protein